MSAIPRANSDRPQAQLIGIDLVICTYNNSAELDKTLTTLSNLRSENENDFPVTLDWSVLVVDNNSTDSTRAVVKRHVEVGRLPGLRRVHEPEQGLHHARRRGMTESDREWIGFIDDDCTLHPDWLVEAARFRA